MKYIQGVYEIIEKDQLTDTIFDYTILAPEMAEKASAGQFINIICVSNYNYVITFIIFYTFPNMIHLTTIT